MSISKRDLEAAVTECERFLRAAKRLKPHLDKSTETYMPSNPANAATIRASMDLSMALATMRRRRCAD